MRKIFLSHKFTGLEKSEMHSVIDPIVDRLNTVGYEIFCSLYHEEEFQDKGMSTDEIYKYCCEVQKDMDMVLGVIWSEKDSHGMKIELEQANHDSQRYGVLIDKKVSNLDRVSGYTNHANFISIVDDINFIKEKERKDIITHLGSIK